MPSNKETLFQNHICAFLEREHGYHALTKAELPAQDFHIIESHLLAFIQATQPDRYAELHTVFGLKTDDEIIRTLKQACAKAKPLWLVMREGLQVRGVKFELYKPKPRSATSELQHQHYQHNRFSYKKEYRYNLNNDERVDLVLWLNGLPIIVVELKHEDEGQFVDDAIHSSFLTRDLNNSLYRLPFLYVAASDTQVKVATDPRSDKHFRWFNAQLTNTAQTHGEYPIEHLYRDAFAKDTIARYLEHFLVYAPAKQEITATGEVLTEPAFSIFPRYHQLRASRQLAERVRLHANQHHRLGLKYLVNHSAGSGKTLTMAWMADQLDSLYTTDNRKVFDNIIILTDRKSLDKNIRDDLERFTHLKSKVHFAKRSSQLADFLAKDRDIIVSTIQKFGYIQDKIQQSEVLKSRRIAFLIDEAHRSQDGKLALKMRKVFTAEGEYEEEEDETPNSDDVAATLEKLNISNQVCVAFTATPTPKTVAFFGEPIDIYSEEEAIQEGYILDVVQHIVSYKTLYHLQSKKALPDKEFSAGVVAKALRDLAFSDDDLIQYKSEVIVKLFKEQVAASIQGRGKAMVVASSRPAGYKYFQTLQTILAEKGLPYKVLFAFSDYTDPKTNQSIEEIKVNQLDTLHDGRVIEEVFEQDDYRILVVANKFQTGFDQPLLSAMFLDKAVKGVNAIQTVSRLNRKRADKEQDDLLVVDFTNSSEAIFKAFNQFRKCSPYQEQEPDKAVLEDIYQQVLAMGAFDAAAIQHYVNAYTIAEKEAKQRNAEADALFSNTKQAYRQQFNQHLPDVEARKAYIALLRRYTKLYYFIAQFFTLESHLHEFIVFAEVMANSLVQQGKVSELKLLLKHIELVKGAVLYVDTVSNSGGVKEPRTAGGVGSGAGGKEMPSTTLEDAIKALETKFQISKEDAIVIREICEEVAAKAEIKHKIAHNRDNILFLEQYEPTLHSEIRMGYMDRDLWGQLQNPIYTDKGGIIPIMGKIIIQQVVQLAA
ncbi:DEAD/DEAH box helicase family protein [Thiothrix subterranea]|uniref:DEAD/DEAH box helicase family protein n=1 Tax=Thiothrix subterranea TaxID=2735563 RepID=A0ABU0YCL7_9GAMM|nr:DEAD/DEAH box helicase family protein [Thiothrix subterranea]MDQ5769472.1 DEAD/DEAH box helicase family protein [Thiothrix subterranea]